MSNDPTENSTDVDVDGYDQQSLELGAFPIDSLMIRSETRTVFEVARRIKNKQYVMDPDFQRDFVWDAGRQSKLIESALLRIPLPVFYLAEIPDGRIVVVDGLQRLTTFYHFIEGGFKLRGLEFARELNGIKFSELSPLLKNRIEDTQLQLYLIDSQVPETAKYEIFERVNSGIPLTRQQMRNCLYVGRATEWLGKMSRSVEFLKATGNSLNAKTMRDRECINRYLAFQSSGWREYSGKMDDFLGETLARMNKTCDPDSLTHMFHKSMELNYIVQGVHAFRKSLIDPGSRSVLNVALFDVLSCVFSEADPARVQSDAAGIRSAIQDLIRNASFNEAISRSTNSVRNVRLRYEMAEATLFPLIR